MGAPESGGRARTHELTGWPSARTSGHAARAQRYLGARASQGPRLAGARGSNEYKQDLGDMCLRPKVRQAAAGVSPPGPAGRTVATVAPAAATTGCPLPTCARARARIQQLARAREQPSRPWPTQLPSACHFPLNTKRLARAL